MLVSEGTETVIGRDEEIVPGDVPTSVEWWSAGSD